MIQKKAGTYCRIWFLAVLLLSRIVLDFFADEKNLSGFQNKIAIRKNDHTKKISHTYGVSKRVKVDGLTSPTEREKEHERKSVYRRKDFYMVHVFCNRIARQRCRIDPYFSGSRFCIRRNILL